MKKIKVFTSTYIQGKRLKRLFKHILNDLSTLVDGKKYGRQGRKCLYNVCFNGYKETGMVKCSQVHMPFHFYPLYLSKYNFGPGQCFSCQSLLYLPYPQEDLDIAMAMEKSGLGSLQCECFKINLHHGPTQSILISINGSDNQRLLYLLLSTICKQQLKMPCVCQQFQSHLL